MGSISDAGPTARTTLRRVLSVVAATLLIGLVPLVGSATTDTASAQQAGAAAVDNRRASLDLDLVSRTYNASTSNWTIVAEATLDSNRICVPLVFDCIVAEQTAPSNATLTQVDCLSPLWNHLVIFRDHCLKQVLHAGYHQRFRFTYVTNPGVVSGTVDLTAEFGRGVLPYVFQQLATAALTVDLDTALDLATSCPATVDSAQSVACTMVVSYPAAAGPTITGISLTDVPDGTYIQTGGTLSHTGGGSGFSCGGLICSAGSLNPGESASFTFAGSAATTTTGGDGSNRADLAWTGPTAGSVTQTDPIVVVGSGDTVLSVTKSADQTTAAVGSPVSWTVTVTNSGAPNGTPTTATDVVVGDVAPALVQNLTLVFTSGVGSWTCSTVTCTAASMPVGSATFTATGTVSAAATAGAPMVNEVGVTWANDIYGPANPATAGAMVAAQVAAATTTTTTTTIAATPARLAFTG